MTTRLSCMLGRMTLRMNLKMLEAGADALDPASEKDLLNKCLTGGRLCAILAKEHVLLKRMIMFDHFDRKEMTCCCCSLYV